MRALMALGLVALFAGAAQAQAPTVELKVGDMAPDFNLQASDGKTYKLSDFRGKKAVVLAWFPKAFTQGCTIECKSLAENGDQIKKYDVSYFMVSTDNVEDQTRFAKAATVELGQGDKKTVVTKKEADFPMLADPTKQAARAYGVLRDFGGQFGEMAQRWTFYIGKDGRIVSIDKQVKPATSAEDMAAKLGELKVDMARR
jgi:peroxiredoxin Q/BCP